MLRRINKERTNEDQSKFEHNGCDNYCETNCRLLYVHVKLRTYTYMYVHTRVRIYAQMFHTRDFNFNNRFSNKFEIYVFNFQKIFHLI